MIKVYIFRNPNNNVYGFKINDHAPDYICSAVSILSQNTVNSIEDFTDIKFECEYEQKGGYFLFQIDEIKNGLYNKDVDLLLNSFVLGIKSIQMEYGKYIKVYDEEVS